MPGSRDHPGNSPDYTALISDVRGRSQQWAPAGWAWYAQGEQLVLLEADGEGWQATLLVAPAPQEGLLGLITGVDNGALGYLLVRNPPELPADRGLALLIAQALGQLLLSGRLEKLEQSHAAVLHLAHEANGALLQAEFFQRVHDILAAHLGALGLYIAASTAEGGLPAMLYQPAADSRLPAEQECDYPLRRFLPALVATMQSRLENKQQFDDATIPVAAMLIPLLDDQGSALGAAMLSRALVHGPFSRADQQFFAQVCAQITARLVRSHRDAHLAHSAESRTDQLTRLNARLHEEVAERERAERLQRSLYEIAELSSQTIETDAFYAQLHAIIGRLVYAKNCFIALYEPAEDLVSFPYYVDEKVPFSPPRKAKRGLTEYVIRRGEPTLLFMEDDKRLMDAGEIAFVSVGGGEDAFSWLGVPLHDQDLVCGVLAIQSYDPAHMHTQRDVELMTFVSHHVSTALSRKRAAGALQLAYQEMEERVQDRTRQLDTANARLKYDNLHDQLTRLPNRTYFNLRLDEAWQRLLQDGTRFSLIFLDLDRFKHINDNYGHHLGDVLLVSAGYRMEQSLRHVDTLARLGGDEFAMLLPDTPNAEIAEDLGRRLIASFDNPIVLAERTLFTTCSMGIVLADPQYHDGPDQVLRDADAAMYQAKARGRDGYVLYNSSLRDQLSGLVDQETALRRALKRQDELLPFVQAIVDGRDGKISSLESLVRWHQPATGWLTPDHFLPAAENSRLIARLDVYMLERLCEWLAAAPTDTPDVHLNCSSLSVIRPEWAKNVMDALSRHGIDPSRLHIELTEGALISDPAQAKRTLDALREGGVSTVLDDFGTGYASLSYVHQFKFDTIKIDKSFVLGITSDPRCAPIVRSILVLAEGLGVGVIAEGVETVAIRDALLDIGPMHLQGYLFARPRPIEGLDMHELQEQVYRGVSAV